MVASAVSTIAGKTHMWAHAWEIVNLCLNPHKAGSQAEVADPFELEQCSRHLRALPHDVITRIMYLKKRSVLASMGRTQKAEQVKWTRKRGIENTVGRSAARPEILGQKFVDKRDSKTSEQQEKPLSDTVGPELVQKDGVLDESMQSSLNSTRGQVTFATETSDVIIPVSATARPRSSPASRATTPPNVGSPSPFIQEAVAQDEQVPFKKYTPAVSKNTGTLRMEAADCEANSASVPQSEEDHSRQLDDQPSQEQRQTPRNQSSGYASGRSSDMDFRPPTTASTTSPTGAPRRQESERPVAIEQSMKSHPAGTQEGEACVILPRHEPSFDWMQIDSQGLPPRSAPQDLARQHRMMSGLHEKLGQATDRIARYSPQPRKPAQIGFDVLDMAKTGDTAAEGMQGGSIGFKIFANPFHSSKRLHQGDIAKWCARHVDLRGDPATTMLQHGLPPRKQERRKPEDIPHAREDRALRNEMAGHARASFFGSLQEHHAESEQVISPKAYNVLYDGTSAENVRKMERIPSGSAPPLSVAALNSLGGVGPVRQNPMAMPGNRGRVAPTKSWNTSIVKRSSFTFDLPLLPNALSSSLHPSGAMTERNLVAKSRDDCPMLNRGIKGKNIVSDAAKVQRSCERQLKGIDHKLAQSRHERPFSLSGITILAPQNSFQLKTDGDAVDANNSSYARSHLSTNGASAGKMGGVESEKDCFHRSESEIGEGPQAGDVKYTITMRMEDNDTLNNAFKMDGIKIAGALERATKDFGFAPHSPRELRSRSRPRRRDILSMTSSPVGGTSMRASPAAGAVPLSPISVAIPRMGTGDCAEAMMSPVLDGQEPNSPRREVLARSPTNQDAPREAGPVNLPGGANPLSLSRGASPERLVISFGESPTPQSRGNSRLTTPNLFVAQTVKEPHDDLAPLPQLKEPPIISFPHAAVSLAFFLTPLAMHALLRA